MLVLNKKNNPDKPHMVYVGRGSNYGNPYRMNICRNDRDVVVALYEEYFISRLLTNRGFREEMEKLNTFHNLVCHCAPEKCHGDVMREFVLLQEEYGQDEAIKMFVKKKGYVHLPLLDGVAHVNIYSKSHCELGRMLSHFYQAPFTHPKYGKFQSVEGFWFYIGTGMKHEYLRDLWGYEAKQAGSGFGKVYNPVFLQEVEEANQCKIEQNPPILKAFLENTKPFLHYYSYGQPHHAAVRALGDELSKMMVAISSRLKPSFKTIIAGSRNFFDIRLFRETMAKVPWNISKIIEGGAKGADHLGALFADTHGIGLETLQANWDTHGKAAGHLRNGDMEKMADKAIVFIKNSSSGSANMIKRMQDAGKETLVVTTF